MALSPRVVFTAAVGTMSLCVAARVAFADRYATWCAACVVAGFLPFVAAVMFRYVVAVAQRADSLTEAWLVRVLGMQVVLAWSIGLSDFLRGPPDLGSAFDRDAAGPLIILSFAPAFLVAHALVRWAQRLYERPTVAVPTQPADAHVESFPFRGRSLAANPVDTPTRTWTLARWIALVAGLALAAPLALDARVPAPGRAAILVFVAALATAGRRSAFAPVGAALFALAMLAFAPSAETEPETAVRRIAALPWLASVPAAAYLLLVEIGSRLVGGSVSGKCSSVPSARG